MRVVVRVEEHPLAGPGSDHPPFPDRRRWIAVCGTGDCTWKSPYQAVKVAAQDEARWHRQQHQRNQL